MTDDLILLASAYLDGEATPDERALVEADPSLLDEVERLRSSARTALLDSGRFEPPGDVVRETAITAALTAWDLAALDSGSPIQASRPAVRQTTVVPFERRHGYTRWLGAAAAVVAVLGLGVLVAQFGGGEGSDDSTAVEAPADTVASGETQTEFEQIEPPADTAGALLSGDIATDDAEDAGDAALDSDAAGAAEATAAAPAAAESAAVPQASLESPEELAMFAATAERSFASNQERVGLIPSCVGDESEGIEYIATGTYRGQPVVIGIDDERTEAIALDPDTCDIVAEAPLP